MTNSITEWTSKRPKEPGCYMMREGKDIYYLVLNRSEFGNIFVHHGSPGAEAAFNYNLEKPEFAKIELSE